AMPFGFPFRISDFEFRFSLGFRFRISDFGFRISNLGIVMRIAHFIQRYPPALGGSEAYFARLSEHLVQRGRQVTVFTTNAHDLEAFWTRRGRCLRPGMTIENGVEVRRYPLWRCPEHRRILKV